MKSSWENPVLSYLTSSCPALGPRQGLQEPLARQLRSQTRRWRRREVLGQNFFCPRSMTTFFPSFRPRRGDQPMGTDLLRCCLKQGSVVINQSVILTIGKFLWWIRCNSSNLQQHRSLDKICLYTLKVYLIYWLKGWLILTKIINYSPDKFDQIIILIMNFNFYQNASQNTN